MSGTVLYVVARGRGRRCTRRTGCTRVSRRRIVRGMERRNAPPHLESGSVLMLVLFVCLAVAVVVQALSAAVLCAEGATIDEAVGRLRLEEKDQGLVALRQQALLTWTSLPWTVVRGGETAVEGSLSELEEGAGWVMKVETKQQPDVSRLTTSAWMERGRDGIDLPLAALVAGSISADLDRETPWLEIDVSGGAAGGPSVSAAGSAVGYLEELPEAPLLGEGCSLTGLSSAWRLDPGWLQLDSRADIETSTASFTAAPTTAEGAADGGKGASAAYSESLPAVAPTSQVAVLTASRGRTVDIPRELGCGSPEAPILVLVRGGADLDARNLGDLYGVLVVDDGSLLLDGTTLHGALFVTEEVRLGTAGRLLFSQAIQRWATDRSLQRTRLVPGTRWEGME